MDPELKTPLKEQLDRLPENVREYIGYSNWNIALDNFLATTSLTEDQQEMATGDFISLLYGITHPLAFTQTLHEDLNISIVEAEELAQKMGALIDPPVFTELLAFNLPQELEDKISEEPDKITPQKSQSADSSSSSSGPKVSSSQPPNLPGSSRLPVEWPKSSQPKSQGSFVDAKLSSMVTTPHTEKTENRPPQKPQSRPSSSNDPYREPV